MTVTSRLFPLIIILSAFVIGASLILAQVDIEYPVPELGNCGNEAECRAYCDDSSHIRECLDFAEEHNLLGAEEIERGRVFADLLSGGSTPGGCTSEAECEAYCSETTHIQECLAFAEEHGFLEDEELDEIRAIASYLEGGGVLPGGCTSEAACEEYCSDVTHMRECLAFADEIGFLPPEERDEAQKVLLYIEAGGVLPGGCTTKESCEAYCESDDHFGECIDFAVGAGFISPEEAEIARKTGGRGPGDCRSEVECEVYCNDPNNQDECFAFALEHGFLSEEDLAHIREGSEQIKQGLAEAPPEVLTCLNDSLGPGVVAELQSGEFTPSRAVGDTMMRCFEEFGPGTEDVAQALNQAPPEVLSCIESKIGADRVAGIRAGDRSALGPDIRETFEECFSQFDGFGPASREGSRGGIQEAFENATPQILGCLQTQIGYDAYVQVREGNYSDASPEVSEAFRYCYGQFGQQMPESFDEGEFHDGDLAPEEFYEGAVPEGFHQDFEPEYRDAFVPEFDPFTEDCLIRAYGSDFKERLARGELSSTDVEAAVQQCHTEEIPPQNLESFEGLQGLLNSQVLLANPLLLFYYLFLPR